MEISDIQQLGEFYSSYSSYFNAVGLIAAGYLLKTARYRSTRKHWTAELEDSGDVSTIKLRSRFKRTIQEFKDLDGDRLYRTENRLHKEAVRDAVKTAEERLEDRLHSD